MLLKSIELQGYKTFAGRTSFEFAGAITCIVGPNGSGKSNIADAIRWVLGEQSFRLLRGKRTEDMIFSGSEQRPRAGMATASIIFDNSSGWLPVDFTEVAIGRRAYRDGTNEYLLNGQRVRLMDITEILSNSGLSQRTYTVIGQGLVDAALALRAEERRGLFEEAAGIGLFRSRREEAQRRLENTRRNLERVEDILAELRPRLRSLERQARRSEQYDQVNGDLRLLLRDYYGFHWAQAQRELTMARDDAQVQKSMFDIVRQEQGELDQRLSMLRGNIQSLRARLGSWHRESSQLHIQRETNSRDLAVSDERVRSISVQQQTTEGELVRLDQQNTLLEERLAETDLEVKQLEEELNEALNQAKSVKQAMQSRKDALADTEKIIHATRQQLTELANHQTSLQTRLTERQSQSERQLAAMETTELDVAKVEHQLKDIEDRVATAKLAKAKVETHREKVGADLQVHRQKIVQAEELQKTNLEDQSKIQTELARSNAQLDVLEQADQALLGYASGTQLILKSAKGGTLSGMQGALSSQLIVPEELETAISAALGDYLDAVLVETGVAADDALEILVDEATRGTLLPLKSLIPHKPIKISPQNGVIGVASELINVHPNIRPAVDLLLGQIIVVEDKTTARKVLAGHPLTTRAVTLKGEVFYASGPVMAGQGGKSGTLSRPRQRRELLAKIAEGKEQIAFYEEQSQSLETKLFDLRKTEKQLIKNLEDAQRQEKAAVETKNQISLEFERIERQVRWQQEQLESLRAEIKQSEAISLELSSSLSQVGEEIAESQGKLREQQSKLNDLSLNEFQSQLNYWNTQAAVAERALDDARNRYVERQKTIQDSIGSREQLKTRLVSFETEVNSIDFRKSELRKQEADVVEKIEALRALIEPAEIELNTSERQQDEIQTTEAKARHALSMADRRYSQTQLNFTRKKEMLDNLRERIEDDLGLVSLEYEDEISGPNPLPFGEMVERLPVVKELPEGLEKTIKRQRAQVRRMGAINPEAQSEFKEVKERFEFMSSQVEDLKNAENDVKEVISELDVLMEREFRKTFEAVAVQFRDIFTRLFGGGTARLVLTDPENLTDTGIDIEARLPGRRTQGLSLLSGGERSLTAAALVFSLLKVSPTPFCVLDEVDAMLDEANVGRFRELLRELAEQTQFIVITHNRNTVQAADVIYGVTMGRDSISQTISLKLDEVANVVN